MKDPSISQDDIIRLNDKIKYSGYDIEKLKSKKVIYEETLNYNIQERQKVLDTAKAEASMFIDAIKNLSFYEYNMHKIRQSQNVRAYSGIQVTQSDEEYIRMISKNCPKCNSLISRDKGCNEMTCSVCHFHFCWICQHPWNEESHKNNYYMCPNQKLFDNENVKNTKSKCGIDFNNLNDTKFYPQPMTMEKRTDFIRYTNLNSKFKENEEKYNNLFKDMMDNHNDVDLEKIPIEKAPFEKLCKRKRIEKVYLKNENPQVNAMRIINTALFAQSVIMWSYPTLYFLSKNIGKAKIFEYQVAELEKNTNQLLKYIDNPSKCSTVQLDNLKKLIDHQIENICDEADISTY